MSEIIHAVYEQGVLRPLTPLHLPEHTYVQISIDLISKAEDERQRVRQVLIEGGLFDRVLHLSSSNQYPKKRWQRLHRD